MPVELLLRRGLGKGAYRLKCRFLLGAFPSERTLEKAKYHAAGLFVSDMAKQGFDYLDKYGFRMSGPFPAVQVVNLPKRSEQQRWHTPSRDMVAAVQAGYAHCLPELRAPSYVSDVPRITEVDDWEFELSGVFVHETLVTEYPDKHEEKEE